MTKQEFIKRWGKRTTGENYTAVLHNHKMEIDLQKVIDHELKNCNLQNVSQQRELLLAFTKKLNNNRTSKDWVYSTEVDSFLANNCG